MASTHKKVIVQKLDRNTLPGYVSQATMIADGKLELLNTSGLVVGIPLEEIKGIYFVREFTEPFAITRKTFTTRPRVEGLWVRLNFKDNDALEAMLPNDLTQLGSDGYLVTPPDTRANTQRIYVPRAALSSMSVLAVIGSPQAKRKAASPDTRQVPMFSE